MQSFRKECLIQTEIFFAFMNEILKINVFCLMTMITKIRTLIRVHTHLTFEIQIILVLKVKIQFEIPLAPAQFLDIPIL